MELRSLSPQLVLGLVLGLVVGLAPATSVQAQGWYAGIQGGLTFAQDADNEDGGVTVESVHDTGFHIGGMAGYDFGNSFRAEGEITYRKNDVDELDLSDLGIPGVGSLDGNGDVSAISFMASGYFDLDLTMPIKPYVGAGIGFANVSLNDVGASASGIDVELADDDDTAFAYQIGAGLSYALNPRTTISVDYRYFATSGLEFDDVSGDDFDSEYKTHNIGVNVRLRF